MDKEWLFDRLRQPALLRKGDEARLRELIARYPYFAAPYLLLGKSLKDQEHPAFDSLLPLISLQAYDRKLLFRLIHESGEEPVREHAVAPLPEKEENIQVPAAEEKAFAEMEQQAKAPVFEVNFAEVEKEETAEAPERAPEELPEIPFGWKPGSTPLSLTEDVEVEESMVEEASTPLSLTEENIELEDVKAEEASVSLSLTEERTEPEIKAEVGEDKMEQSKVDDTNGQAERSRSAISRTDFFHWLDRLNEKEDKPEVKLKGSNYQLPTTNYNKVAEETSPTVEKEPASKDELAIIDRFIETNPSVSRMKTEFYNPIDKARESERLDDNLVTETLARIFVAQEKYERAIAAYEKLQLKFPQKSDYFAALIEELKEKLN